MIDREEMLPESAHIDLPEELAVGAKDGVFGLKVFVHDDAEVAFEEGDAVPASVTADDAGCDAEKHDGVGEKIGDA